jgi:putative methionine-R-sulfoxide reductase with GAF domain
MPTLGPNPAEIGQPLAHPQSERRRRVRHKLHLPAYVGLNPALHPTPDLCEIIDLSEDGMAIQSASPLEVGHDENLFLDLPETSASVETHGTVIWSDAASGRAGIHFLDLPPEPLHAIKKWLFADALVACAQHAAETAVEPLAENELDRWQQIESDYTSVLTALAAVRKEVDSLGTDLDAALHLIARRAQAFTRSTASAIGLSEGPDMICRATAGASAPAVGTRLRVGSGFSGECVRSGILLRCDDSETDPRVDRESCRALGIRSMIAAPIRSRGLVVGLIEVFAPEPNIFQPDHELVLQHLTEVVSVAVYRSSSAGSGSPAVSVASVDDEFPVETPADLPIPHLSHSRNLLIISGLMTFLLAVLWVTQPWVSQLWVTQFWTTRPGATDGRVSASSAPSAPQSLELPASPAKTMDALQKLAAGGDPAAQFDLGVRYWTGDQAPQDYAQAVRWFSSAAEQGNVAAQAMLSNCYWAGRGIAADPMRAYFWAFLAQAAGDEASKARVALLAARLTPAQIAVAQKQGNDWMKRHPRAAKDSSPAQ